MYRSPDGDYNLFLNALERMFSSLNRYRTTCKLVVGGYNVLDHGNPRLKDLVNLLKSLNLNCANCKPTRFEACLDNVATDLRSASYGTEVLPWALSDHVALRLVVERPAGVGE